jgi:hypothetical protein
MFAPVTIQLPTTTLVALQEYLQFSDSKLSVEQSVVLAIREWLANNGASASGDPSDILRGYQWKSIFLPHATQLRMSYAESTYYAEVVGDAILYQGRPTSPRGFTMAIAGSGRNAWRDLFIKFPDSRLWKRAGLCRIEQQKQAKQPVPSSIAAMTAAAAAMTEALKTTLNLVERTNASTAIKSERRVTANRRTDDRLEQDCAFD